MVVGIGIDLVEIHRMKKAIERPLFVQRVFTPAEQAYCDSRGRQNAASYAARFAAKEAVIKCLGDVAELRPLECVVVTAESGKPIIELSGRLAELASAAGVTDWHVALYHDGGNAIAYVIAERQ